MGGLADDEAVRHVADPGGGGAPERLAAGAAGAHAHRGVERRRALVDLVEEAGEVRDDVVDGAAGRHDVDEPEQRGARSASAVARSIALASRAFRGLRDAAGSASRMLRPISRMSASVGPAMGPG